MQQTSTRAFLLVALSLVHLNGCAAPLALTLLGVGAGVTTGTAVSYTMDGIAYRTFTAPLPQVERATLTALNDMGMAIEGTEKTDEGKDDKSQGSLSVRSRLNYRPLAPRRPESARLPRTEYFLKTERPLRRSFYRPKEFLEKRKYT